MEDAGNFKETVTVAFAMDNITGTLEAEGFDTPALDAELIISHVLGKDRAYILAHPEHEFSEDEILRINEEVSERLCCRPVAYIIGEKDFYDRSFYVDERVLIPRPDTEVLVEEALKATRSSKEDISVLDLCCGSGAIGLTIAGNLPRAKVTLSDISPDALDVARINAARFGLTDKVRFTESDLFDGLSGERFDMILSNPPYISSDEMIALSPEITQWEPHSALYGGSDGLSFYRSILSEAKEYLAQGGEMLLEIGESQGSEVTAIAEANGFSVIRIIKDLAGMDRVVNIKEK
ncbi:MAG: peptide chain release factor N(5)-glutamine methyltransferase [Eubacteriales bacterium]|nr:peptide chain release factor N(5)-glutamine methyltransferase [Eubacteriales bacterium]